MKMNSMIRGKVAIVCTVLFLGVGVSAFSQEIPSLNDLTRTMETFAESMARSLPFNASMGLNWADAHIGRFFPAFPPSFGAGVSFGFTTMDNDPLANLLNGFLPGLSGDLLSWGGFPIPGAMLEGRIGGFFLPFDVGVKIGWLPDFPGNFNVDYFIVGADIRYAVLEGNLILPTISVGVGANFLSGGVGRELDRIEFNYGGANPLTIANPTLGINWQTTTIDFKAQVSRPLLIITPYLGVGASIGWTTVSYGLDTNITDMAMTNELREILGAMGIDLDGFSYSIREFGWGFRAFGGLSFNLPFIRLDLTGLWDFGNNFGVTFGARFQM